MCRFICKFDGTGNLARWWARQAVPTAGGRAGGGGTAGGKRPIIRICFSLPGPPLRALVPTLLRLLLFAAYSLPPPCSFAVPHYNMSTGSTGPGGAGFPGMPGFPGMGGFPGMSMEALQQFMQVSSATLKRAAPTLIACLAPWGRQ